MAEPPAEAHNFVSTGIAGLDAILGGGFLRSGFYLLQGNPGSGKTTLALWAERKIWMDILDRMPLTLCHFDIWRPNLLAVTSRHGQEQTVALDWQCMGLGPAGEVGNLLLTSLMTLQVKSVDAKELDSIIWENYLQGLHAAGWKANRQQVRFCYTAYPVLRWGAGLSDADDPALCTR